MIPVKKTISASSPLKALMVWSNPWLTALSKNSFLFLCLIDHSSTRCKSDLQIVLSLGIESTTQLNAHYLKSGLFETLILTELAKNHYNKGLEPRTFFGVTTKVVR
jgi:hypothetical protein